MPALLLFTKISQVLKTINASFVPVAPTKVQSVAPHNIEIADLEFIRNNVWLQCPLSRPLIDALCARAYASQSCRVVVAHSIVGPCDSQLGIALLRNLARFDRLSSLCNLSHSDPFRRSSESKEAGRS